MQTTAAEATENPAMLKLRLAKLGISVADASLARAGALELVLPDESWVRARVESGSPLALLSNKETSATPLAPVGPGLACRFGLDARADACERRPDGT